MSEDESASKKGKESLGMEIKTMMSNMFAEFKTDMMQSVTESMETRINEWYEENDYSVEDEPVVDNTLDVNALMQTVLASNKGEAGTLEPAKTVSQATEFDTLLTELNPEKAHGPPTCEKLGVLVNSLLKEGLSKDQLTMKKEYLKPENCPTLETPKVNTMLWGQLKQDQKNLDLSLQKGQGHLMSSVYALLSVQPAGRQSGQQGTVNSAHPRSCVITVCKSTIQSKQKRIVEASSEQELPSPV